tara:strand:- start:20 stop:928 length:909 start_codon:yes stop_codon:yes gene_type:complete
MKNLFITGAHGQDGTIIRAILKRYKNIKVYSVVERKKKFQKKRGLIKLNLSNKDQIRDTFSKIRPDIIIHLGSKNPSFKQKNYKKYFQHNMLTTKNIFFAAFERNINTRFIFCNSSHIFKKREGVVNEKSNFFYNKERLNSDYSKFRLKSHQLMSAYKNKNNINYTNVILFNHDSIYRNKKFLIPRIMIALKKKKYKFLKEIINENISADFSHAKDICQGLIKISLSKKNIDNVILSSGRLTKINDIINFVIKKEKIILPFDIYSRKKTKGLVGNNSLAKKKYNWFPKKNIFDASLEIFKND